MTLSLWVRLRHVNMFFAFAGGWSGHSCAITNKKKALKCCSGERCKCDVQHKKKWTDLKLEAKRRTACHHQSVSVAGGNIHCEELCMNVTTVFTVHCYSVIALIVTCLNSIDGLEWAIVIFDDVCMNSQGGANCWFRICMWGATSLNSLFCHLCFLFPYVHKQGPKFA